MSITVYWSFLGPEWMRVKEPSLATKSFYAKDLHEETDLMNFHKCPFFNEHLKNVYSLCSPYDYSFFIKDNQVFSELYDQDFFNRQIIIRSIEKKCFSFALPYVFFTEEKSLEVSVPVFPYLENNHITDRCISFAGTLDIGKYFRTIDFAFFLKNPYNEFIIKENEVFGYADFKTKDKIIFKQFYPTKKIKSFVKDVNKSKQNKFFIYQKPTAYYNNFKLKKLILKEIKQNLI
jgi:hypothetical protein